MSIELRPLGIKCNIMCQYCYQNPMRDSGNVANHYNMESMKSAIREIDEPFVLFGGEPLLMPIDDLEHLWAWGLKKYGQNACQTNATLITEQHINLFKKYQVKVGVSVDGPGEMNDTRWAGSLKKPVNSVQKPIRPSKGCVRLAYHLLSSLPYTKATVQLTSCSY